MELIEAIYGRRAVRKFTSQPVPRPILHELVQAAVQAPSAMNAQLWSFAFFQGAGRIREFSDRAKAHFLTVFPPGRDPHAMKHDLLNDPKFNLFYGAGTLVVVYAKPGGQFAAVDCSLAAGNFMLAAHGMGLGTCPVGFAQPWFDVTEVKLELGIPTDYTAVLPIAIGYPAEAPAPAGRKEPEILGAA
jgi:nitroreductase